MNYVDTETCGLHGPTVLLQWAEGEGPVHLHSVWHEPARKTLDLIERLYDGVVIAYNLAFDAFHLCQTYTTLRLLDPDSPPDPETYALKEPEARDGPCLKPRFVFDLMLHARKGPYQSTLDRETIRVRRVPTPLARLLAEELESRVPLDDIYFARRKKKGLPKWQIFDTKSDDFKTVVLKFHPSTALKALAAHALKLPRSEILTFGDVELSKKLFPREYGYAPFALAVGAPGKWNWAWPDVLKYHVKHWSTHEKAREYATKDVIYLQRLYEHFGRPEPDDDDSTLAAMVGAVRWRGFRLDLDGIRALREHAVVRMDNGAPKAPKQVKAWVTEAMNDVEKLVLAESTKKVLLEEVSKWEGHPAAERARAVLDARLAAKEKELYDKLLLAGRLHAGFKVIGTLSGRMAGADGLNAQGIKKAKQVRKCFPLADGDLVLCGGDFSAFEVSLAEAAYKDEGLRKDLLTGKKIHALFGVHVYPHMTYEQILDDEDKYTDCKRAVFGMFYGGDENTLKDRLGVDLETARLAVIRFGRQYPAFATERKRVSDMFCSMRQPGGIGTRVVWHEPAVYIESLFGFRRYFTLENKVCKALFDLAQRPPREWRAIKVKVRRRDREQTASGAVQSALYGAAFGIQSAAMRAALNHVIQSSGATICKRLQRRLWDLQPAGVSSWAVQPMNVHDEIMCPTDPAVIDAASGAVSEVVELYKTQVPLLKIDWKTHMESWAGK